MNKIESLIKSVKVNDNYYAPQIYLTAWDNWCISYCNVNNTHDYLCSVCVEPKNQPRNIEDTIGSLNEYIGNARNIDDAVDMITNYIIGVRKKMK
jgi:hypothetical protein